MKITDRVATGAAWLDIAKPGWEARIDLGKLDMADWCLCVLGQVFAEFADPENDIDDGFDYAVDVLHVNATATGFDVSSTDYRDDPGLYVALGTEWKRLIAERRSAS